MGIFAFRRMREQEATKSVAPAPLKKTKRKPKLKTNMLQNFATKVTKIIAIRIKESLNLFIERILGNCSIVKSNMSIITAGVIRFE